MDLLPMAMIQATNANRAQVLSALPDAPVVPHVERRSRAVRPRAALARGLERVAQVIAPTTSTATTCTTAH